jgi:hypothetical protein
VAVDVGFIRRWIDVEPNRHSEILRLVPGAWRTVVRDRD